MQVYYQDSTQDQKSYETRGSQPSRTRDKWNERPPPTRWRDAEGGGPSRADGINVPNLEDH
ncbi:MAG: hypothetical protein CBARDCOR_3498 [uncultured Caballeronia sp.]|nr:MAG: hypothetical protein CBARDCOR_3498 [uncultured Caballeronia sp.]